MKNSRLPEALSAWFRNSLKRKLHTKSSPHNVQTKWRALNSSPLTSTILIKSSKAFAFSAFLGVSGFAYSSNISATIERYFEKVIPATIQTSTPSSTTKQNPVNGTTSTPIATSNARVSALQGGFPIQRGMALVSRLSNPNAIVPGEGSNQDGSVLGLFDLRNPSANNAPSSALTNWTEASNSVYRHPEWTNARMGEVFGIEIDNSVPESPQVFVGSNGTFVGDINGADQYPGRLQFAENSTAGGDIYRLDGTTGNVTTLTSTIPSVAYASAGGRGAKDISIPLNTTNGRVKDITISNGGTGYATFDPIVITPNGSTAATGYVVATNGVITSIVITARGAGFGTAPVSVNVTSTNGTGFIGEVVIGYPLQTGIITVPTEEGGTNYTTAAGSLLNATGTGGAATPTFSSGTLTSLNVTVAGVDYTTSPKYSINNRFTGVGNIGYNYAQKVVYTSSIDNGKIYAINATTGALIGNEFDHNPTVADPVTAVTHLTRLAIGMAWNPKDNRLYFSRPATTGYEETSIYYNFTHNEIVSIGLNPDGSINTLDTIRQEMLVPVTKLSLDQNSLITDIEFTSDGSIALLGEMSTGPLAFRLHASENRFVKGSHNAIAREYRFRDNVWNLQTEYKVGNTYNGYNNAGGVDFGYGNSENPEEYYDSAVLSGDYLNGDGYTYGLQVSPLSQGNFPNKAAGEFNHYIIDDNTPVIGLFAEKTGVGDVDVFSGVDYPSSDVVISATSVKPSSCGTSDGSIIITGSGNGLLPNTPYPISYKVNGSNTPIEVSITSNSNGEIVISNLPAGNYTEIQISDPPTYISNLVQADISCVVLSGTVFHDANALLDIPTGIVNGTPIQLASDSNLHANLFDSTGVFIATTPINAQGSYTFNVFKNTNYQVTISTTAADNNSTLLSSTNLPLGWVNTGENVGISAGNDGTVDGILLASVAEVDRPEVNFGIQSGPQTAVNLQPTQVNPGGTISVTVPATAFVSSNVTDPSTSATFPNTGDITPGIVTNIIITAFPSNATSITIDGNVFTTIAAIETAYPNGLPTNASGEPTVPVLVDPVDGAVSVIIPIAAVDNGGLTDSTPGSITLPFTANTLVLSGTVFHDTNGLLGSPANTVDGTAIQTASGQTLHANLFDALGNFLSTTPIASNGTYEFTSPITANTSYLVTISTIPASPGSTPATTTTLPNGWINTGENVGTTAGADNAPDGILIAAVGTVNRPEVNFGIQQIPNSDNKQYTFTTAPTLGAKYPLDGTVVPELTGSDPEDQAISGSLENRTIAITTLPDNGELWYNGVKIEFGQDGITAVSPTNPFIITDLVTSDLEVELTQPGSTSLTFTYALVDQAGAFDPTPATYTLNWTTALPVRLASFTAKKEGNSTVLQWVTTSEINSEQFDVEYSSDAKNWTKLGSVAAARNSVRTVSYSFTHGTSTAPVNYYRLKIVDQDGSFEWSKIVSMEGNIHFSASVYPNPTTDFITIQSSQLNTISQIRIMNIQGKEVTRKTSNFDSKITVSGYSPGTYLLVIETKTGGIFYQRFIVAK